MILFGQAVCGTLGGGCPEKSLPFHWFMVLDLVGVSNHLFRASNRAFLAVCGSQFDSFELLLVTPLAFSDLALARLGGTLLMGGSGVEVLLI